MRLGSPIPSKRARIEIIPLIDVMFFLLASFMMVSLSMQRLRTLNIDLPSAVVAKSTQKPDMLDININRDGDTYVDKKRYSMPDLEALIRDRLRSNTNLPIYVKPSGRTSHGAVVTVLDTVRIAGGQKLSVAIGEGDDEK
jgi:biopolymer transport protein ExbD